MSSEKEAKAETPVKSSVHTNSSLDPNKYVIATSGPFYLSTISMKSLINQKNDIRFWIRGPEDSVGCEVNGFAYSKNSPYMGKFDSTGHFSSFVSSQSMPKDKSFKLSFTINYHGKIYTLEGFPQNPNYTPPTPDQNPSKATIITLDSNRNDVLKVMGKPDYEMSSYGDSWRMVYDGTSTVYLHPGREGNVIGWTNYENKLKVTMGKKVDSAPPVTLGSTKEDVIKACGPPLYNDPYFNLTETYEGPSWDYANNSYINFDRDYKVIG